MASPPRYPKDIQINDEKASFVRLAKLIQRFNCQRSSNAATWISGSGNSAGVVKVAEFANAHAGVPDMQRVEDSHMIPAHMSMWILQNA
jgi:hypothetical protein